MGHPLQLGITILFVMALCGLGGRMLEAAPGTSAWLFFAALFICAFGVLLPAGTSYNRAYRRRGPY